MKLTTTTIIRAFLTIAIFFSLIGCEHDYERIMGSSPDDRVRQQIGEYQNLLMTAPFGWKTSLYTGTGAGYFYYFDFNDNGTVVMLSDFDESTAGEAMESTWTIKGLQRPTLSFTTYSYIHLPADPDGDVNNGIPGSGLLSDFEFAFIRVSGDSVILKGIQHGSEAIMTPATEQETQAYFEKRIKQLIEYSTQYLSISKGYRLTLPNDEVVPLALSISQKLISFQYLDDDGETIRTPTTSFIFTTDGIRLKEPLVIDGYSVPGLIWNDENSSYHVQFDSPVSLAPSDEPYIFYTQTPLYSKLGHEVVTAAIPYLALANPLPGHSDSFTEAYQFAATQMLEGPYQLTLDEIRFGFIPNTDRMLLTLSLVQPVEGGGSSRFQAQYTYSYLVREGGVIKFKLEGFDENAGILFENMIGILSHFDNDTFRMEYLGGDFSILAGFFSQEDPGYHFSGYLK